MQKFIEETLKQRREHKGRMKFDPKVIDAQHQYINSFQFYASLGRMGSFDRRGPEVFNV